MTKKFEYEFVPGVGLCGTVLKDHPDVLKQSQKYYTLTSKDSSYQNLVLPKEFNGLERWQGIITYDYGQNGPADWVYIAKEMFLIRFNLATYKLLFIPDVSDEDVLLRIEKPPIKPFESSPSSQFVGQPPSIFQGYSLYDALEYCYLYGFLQTYCYNDALLSQVVDLTKVKTMEEKLKIVKDNAELFDRSHCLSKVGDKFVGRRLFRINGIANVGLGTDESLQDDIFSIKAEIYRWGPVIGGFLMYDDFKKYDGKTIYKGPSKDSKPIGGHSIGILGWGYDEKDGEYWILENSWGVDFGLLGIFKMKIGIKECMLEKNVVTITPDLSTKHFTHNEIKVSIADPLLAQKRELVNPRTFLTQKTTEEIERGVLVEIDGRSRVTDLIRDPSELIDISKFFAANVDLVNYLQNIKNSAEEDIPPDENTDSVDFYIILCLSVILLTFIFYKMVL